MKTCPSLRASAAILFSLALTTACADDVSVGGGSATASGTESGATDTDVASTGGDTCGNGVQDADETDVDCGGSCDLTCGSGQGCGGDDDCEDGTVCTSADVCGQDAGGNCEDGVQTGDETDVDCGGSCPDACGDGGGCDGNDDCVSGVCDADVCQDPTCEDGVHNGDETDVDCGGGTCEGCDDGEMCLEGPDCQSAVCEDEACAEPTCEDGAHNGDETDVDCGGSCPNDCEIDEGCIGNEDCLSGACDERAGLCVDSTCKDSKLDGDETDVDCGGSCGATCENGEECLIAGDCISDSCDAVSGTCVDETCVDMQQNQDETDVDCGGVCGATCGTDEGCDDAEDCLSSVCDPVANTCDAPTCTDGVENGNETALDCGGSCPPCDDGLGCNDDDECISGVCDMDGTNLCQATLSVTASPPCSDFAGAAVQLDAVAMDGTGNYSYSWSPIAGLDDPTSPTPLASPAGFETYTVTVDDGVNQRAASVTVVNTEPLNLENNCTLYTSQLLTASPVASISYDATGTVACEAGNNDFGLHLCEGVVFQEANLQGTIGVQAGAGDNDWIGLVWNAQSNSQFYSLAWKREAQSAFGCNTPMGIVVKRVFAPDFASVVGEDLYCPGSTTNSAILNLPADTTIEGWVAGEDYEVSISYSDAAGGSEVIITRLSDSFEMANFLVADTTYPNGSFGSTTLSQEMACTGPLEAQCQPAM